MHSPEQGNLSAGAERGEQDHRSPEAREYIEHHLPGASEQMRSVAEGALELSPDELDDMASFIEQLKRDRQEQPAADTSGNEEATAESTAETIDSIRQEIKNFEGTREELAALARRLGEANTENPGMIENTASGTISAERAANAIEQGYGGNVSDIDLQRAADRVYAREAQGNPETEEVATEAPETIDSIRQEIKNFEGTREELAALVRRLGEANTDNPGYVESTHAGTLNTERMAKAIEDGYGENVSDPDVQYAARRNSL